ncbi:MAG: PPC domain-containing DNA-binding protein [Candidatus Bipolaricaulia bacterium]
MIKVESGDELIVKLEDGEDLLERLTELGIDSGLVWGIGMLRGARLGYWTGEGYEEHRIEEPAELLSLQCNLSLKDGKPFPHCHAVLSRRDGTVAGGHLLAATVHNVNELYVKRLSGIALERRREPSGLFGLHLGQ